MPASTIPALQVLRARARCIRALRAFFDQRGYLEVETPILRPSASIDPYLVSFETTLRAPDGRARQLHAHTSPEYAMKRLLGAHGASIFQLATVFRNEEHSDTHHHEFSMLEWYRVGKDYRFLMDETEDLIRALTLSQGDGHLRRDGLSVDVTPPFERLTIREAFLLHAGFDPLLYDADALRKATQKRGCFPGPDWDWDDTFHLALLELVEPHLGVSRPTFLYDYPASLASLALIRLEAPTSVAERFELYACGLELCNGFTELTDPKEQRARFETEQRQRADLDLPPHPLDEELLEALASMPPSTGNALGFDRLLMLIWNLPEISAVRFCEGHLPPLDIDGASA